MNHFSPNPPPIHEPPQRAGRRVHLPIAQPLWTYIFLGAIVLIYITEWILSRSVDGSISANALVQMGANYAPYVAQGQYWRLFTANFLHVNILHIAVNGYSLYILGREVEALFGHRRFVVLYLLSGICGAVFSFMITQGLSAGASTSLFGLFAALGIFFYKQRKLLGDIGRQQLINLGVILLINVIIGLSPGSAIDNWGHVGGLVGGAILGWFLCPDYTLVDSRPNTLSPVTSQPRPELSNDDLMDSNSLGKQSFAVGIFALGLVVLTIFARMIQ